MVPVFLLVPMQALLGVTSVELGEGSFIIRGAIEDRGARLPHMPHTHSSSLIHALGELLKIWKEQLPVSWHVTAITSILYMNYVDIALDIICFYNGNHANE